MRVLEYSIRQNYLMKAFGFCEITCLVYDKKLFSCSFEVKAVVPARWFL